MIDLYLKKVFSTRACWWYPSYVQEHSVVEALQQQRPESAGQFRRTPLSVSTNIDSIDSAYMMEASDTVRVEFPYGRARKFQLSKKIAVSILADCLSRAVEVAPRMMKRLRLMRIGSCLAMTHGPSGVPIMPREFQALQLQRLESRMSWNAARLHARWAGLPTR